MSDGKRVSAVDPGVTVVLALLLLVVGLVMVASATAPLDRSLTAAGFWKTTFGRQVAFAVVGLVLMMVVARWISPLMFASPRGARWLPGVALFLAVACLVAVFIPGVGEEHRGALRWLRVGSSSWGLSFQPSEFAKLALVLFLAWLLARGKSEVRSFRKGFAPASLAIALVAALVGKEDFGTGALIGGIGLLMLFVAGCRWLYLAGAGVLGACGLTLLIRLEPYRLERIIGFLDPHADALGAGYHPLQSLRTIASGGWLGVGLGAGIQKHGYLPESQTDFIFAIICEELGLLGGFVVIGLFAALVWAGLRVMRAAPSSFERLLAFGLTTMLGLQAVMHIAVVTVCAPTTGMSLPLVSAGGSGMLTSCVAIGMLTAIAARGRCGAGSRETVMEWSGAGGRHATS
jgi:cell division protein FtsW